MLSGSKYSSSDVQQACLNRTSRSGPEHMNNVHCTTRNWRIAVLPQVTRVGANLVGIHVQFQRRQRQGQLQLKCDTTRSQLTGGVHTSHSDAPSFVIVPTPIRYYQWRALAALETLQSSASQPCFSGVVCISFPTASCAKYLQMFLPQRASKCEALTGQVNAGSARTCVYTLLTKLGVGRCS
jgi:hypothetical protein